MEKELLIPFLELGKDLVCKEIQLEWQVYSPNRSEGKTRDKIKMVERGLGMEWLTGRPIYPSYIRR